MPAPATEAADADRLRAEVLQLRAKVASRPVIDQARGMVMALGPCSSRTAWEVLVEVSQHTNTKLRHVAHALVATTEGIPMPPAISDEFTAAFHRCRDRRR